eukprot:1555544-Rhodomonas_salina.5
MMMARADHMQPECRGQLAGQSPRLSLPVKDQPEPEPDSEPDSARSLTQPRTWSRDNFQPPWYRGSGSA